MSLPVCFPIKMHHYYPKFLLLLFSWDIVLARNINNPHLHLIEECCNFTFGSNMMLSFCKICKKNKKSTFFLPIENTDWLIIMGWEECSNSLVDEIIKLHYTSSGLELNGSPHFIAINQFFSVFYGFFSCSVVFLRNPSPIPCVFCPCILLLAHSTPQIMSFLCNNQAHQMISNNCRPISKLLFLLKGSQLLSCLWNTPLP